MWITHSGDTFLPAQVEGKVALSVEVIAKLYLCNTEPVRTNFADRISANRLLFLVPRTIRRHDFGQVRHETFDRMLCDYLLVN